MSLEFLPAESYSLDHNVWLTYGAVYVILVLAVFVEHRLVSDRQTDIHNDSLH